MITNIKYDVDSSIDVAEGINARRDKNQLVQASFRGVEDYHADLHKCILLCCKHYSEDRVFVSLPCHEKHRDG